MFFMLGCFGIAKRELKIQKGKDVERSAEGGPWSPSCS